MHLGQNGGLGGIHEQAGDGSAGEIVHAEGQQGVADGDPGDGHDALADAVRPAGAQVLAAVGGHGDAGGLHGGGHDVVHPGPGGHGGHRPGAQTVDGALEDDGANGGDGELQAHGHADGGDIAHAPQAGPQVAAAEMQGRYPGVDVQQAGQPGSGLGDDGGQGGPLHAHAAGGHEQNIQHHVDDHRGDQEQQGGAAVAQGPQNTGAEIVQDGGPGAHEDDEDVGVSVVIDFGGGVDQAENIVGGEKGQHRQAQGKNQAQPDQLAGAAADGLLIPGAEALGDGDGKAGADAQGKAQHQEVQRPGGAHGGKGVDAQQPAHDDAVGQVIKLLEQVAHQQRRTEGENPRKGGPCGHVSCHKTFLLSEHKWQGREYCLPTKSIF